LRKELLEKEGDIKTILVDGIRSPYEIELFKENFENFISVSIYASPQTRFKRISLRGREDDTTDFDEFMVRENRELGFGIGNVVSTTDYLIENECSLEEFKQRVAEFVEKEMD
jgi:dephospho-CoA kinase